MISYEVKKLVVQVKQVVRFLSPTVEVDDGCQKSKYSYISIIMVITAKLYNIFPNLQD